MKILALDVSTVATGWAVFEDDKLMDWGVINPNSELLEGSKAYYVSQTVAVIMEVYRPDEITIEDTFFLKNVNTLKVLNRIAGQIQHAWFKFSGKEAVFYMAMTARKDFPGLKGNAEKEEIVTAVNEKFFSRKKEANKLTDHNTADAIVLGYHHYLATTPVPKIKVAQVAVGGVASKTVVTKKIVEEKVDTGFAEPIKNEEKKSRKKIR